MANDRKRIKKAIVSEGDDSDDDTPLARAPMAKTKKVAQAKRQHSSEVHEGHAEAVNTFSKVDQSRPDISPPTIKRAKKRRDQDDNVNERLEHAVPPEEHLEAHSHSRQRKKPRPLAKVETAETVERKPRTNSNVGRGKTDVRERQVTRKKAP